MSDKPWEDFSPNKAVATPPWEDFKGGVPALPPQPSMLGQLGQAFMPSQMEATFDKGFTGVANVIPNIANSMGGNVPLLQPGQSILGPEVWNTLKVLLGGDYKNPGVGNTVPASNPIVGGLANSVVKAGQGMTTPGVLAALPLASEAVGGNLLSKIVQAAFTAGMAHSGGQAVGRVVQDVRDPSKSKGQVAEDVGDAAIGLGGAGLGMLHAGASEGGVENKAGVARETTGKIYKAQIPLRSTAEASPRQGPFQTDMTGETVPIDPAKQTPEQRALLTQQENELNERQRREGKQQQPPVVIGEKGRESGDISGPWDQFGPRRPLVEKPMPGRTERDLQGGQVSFSAEAGAKVIPNARQSVVEQLPDKEAMKLREFLAEEDAKGTPVKGQKWLDSYRRPQPAPTEREAELKRQKANVEKGLTIPETPMEPLPQETGNFPEGQPGKGVLSQLQRDRLRVALEKGKSIDYVKNVLRQKPIEPANPEGGKAGRLQQLNNTPNLSPEDIKERDALQAESDSVREKMQALWKKDLGSEKTEMSDEDFDAVFQSVANKREKGFYRPAVKTDSGKLYIVPEGDDNLLTHTDVQKTMPRDEIKNSVNGFVGKDGKFKTFLEVARDNMEGQEPSLNKIKDKAHPVNKQQIENLGLKEGIKGHELAANIAANPQYFGHEEAALADFLGRKFPRALEQAKVEFGHNPQLEEATGVKSAAYQYDTHTVYLNAGRQGVGDLGGDALHELSHAATAWQYRFPKTETQVKAVEEMDDLMKQALDALPKEERAFFDEHYKPAIEGYQESKGKYDSQTLGSKAKEMGVDFYGWHEVFYGLTNNREFIGKIFDSPQFRQWLDSIPVEGKSMLGRFVDKIKELLGIGEQDTLLSRALDNMMAVGEEGDQGYREETVGELEKRRGEAQEPLGPEHDEGVSPGAIKIPTIKQSGEGRSFEPMRSPQPLVKFKDDETPSKSQKVSNTTHKFMEQGAPFDLAKKMAQDIHSSDKAMPRAIEKAADDLDKARAGLSNLWQQHDMKASRIPAMADEADNRGRILARQFANDVKDRLATAIKTTASQVKPVHEAALTMVIESGGDAAKLHDMEMKVAGRSEWWAKDAQRAVGYAIAHTAELKPVADYYERINRQQVRQENAVGIDTLFRENYVAHVQDLSDIDSILFEGGKKGASGSYTYERKYETYADSIAAGIKPRSLSSIDNLEHRVSAGQRRISRELMVQQLGRMNDPASGKKIVVPVQVKKRVGGKDSISVPPGYNMLRIGESTVGVHKAYTGLLENLNGSSAIANSPAGRAFMTGAHTVKHLALLFDFYHPIRLWAYSAPLRQGEAFSSSKPAWLSLDYNRQTLERMASRGEIDPAMLPELLRKKQVAELAIKSGYNIGRIQDNLYSSLTEMIPGIGRYNKWLFDKYQRGVMLSSYDIEYQRQRALLPKLSEADLSRKVSRELNTRFGNLGKESWIKSQTMQDLLRTVFLAPNWNEGILRSELGAYASVGTALGEGVKKGSLPEGGRNLIASSLAVNAAALFASIFAGNQLINYATRGKPTWENNEKQPGAKISAWIPAVDGKSDGFFLNPYSMAAEITHQLINRAEKDKSVIGAVDDVINNKLSDIGNIAKMVRTREDWQGNHLSDWEIIKEAGKVVASKPIQGPAILAAVTGKEQAPGAAQRSLMASVGVKTDPVQLDATEKIARQAGKPIEAMGVGERMRAEKALPKRVGGSSEAAAKKAIEYEAELHKAVKAALPSEVSSWLDKNKINFGAYRESITENKEQVPLTDKEKEEEQRLVVEEFTKRLRVVKKDSEDRGNMSHSRLQNRVNLVLTAARRRVKAEMKQGINATAKSYSP